MQDIREIERALRERNVWWSKKFKIEFKARKLYNEIKKFIDKKQIIALTGLRRVGKTTIMYKIIEEYLDLFEAQNIFYFSFDDFRQARIGDIFETYEKVFGKNLSEGNYLVCLDEIQKLEGWDEQLKRYYDTYPNIKFIISGSASLFIRKKTRESLAGRFFEFEVKPLDFEEFLDFKGIKIGRPLSIYEKDIMKAFREYLITNGFPEIVNEDLETSLKYIKENIIEVIIYKDIPETFDIKDRDLLMRLFRIIMYEPGQVIEISNLASDLSASRQTISAYLGYLEDAFLIRKLYNFSKNARKTEKKSKKFYSRIIYPDLVNSEKVSLAFEQFIVLQLNAEFFYRDPQKNEVDIIIYDLLKKKISPIEVKYGKVELDGLKRFMSRFNTQEGVVISYNKKNEITTDLKKIHIIPFYVFLLDKQKFLTN